MKLYQQTKQSVAKSFIILGIMILLWLSSLMSVSGLEEWWDFIIIDFPILGLAWSLSWHQILVSPSNDLSAFDRFVVKQFSDTQWANSDLFFWDFSEDDFFHWEDVLVDITLPWTTSIHGIVLWDWPTANKIYFDNITDQSALLSEIVSLSFGTNMTRYNEIFLDKEFLSVLITFSWWFHLELIDLVWVDQLPEPFDSMILADAWDGTFGDPITNEATIAGMLWLLTDNIRYTSSPYPSTWTVIAWEIFVEWICHIADLSVDMYETWFVVKNLTDTLIGWSWDVFKPEFVNSSSFMDSDFGASLTIWVNNNLWSEDPIIETEVFGMTVGTWATANQIIFYFETDLWEVISSISSLRFWKNITQYYEIFTDKEFLSVIVDMWANVLILYDLIWMDQEATEWATVESILLSQWINLWDGEFWPPETDLANISMFASLLEDNMLFAWDADFNTDTADWYILLWEFFNEWYCHIWSTYLPEDGIVVKNLTDTQIDWYNKDSFINPSSFLTADFWAWEPLVIDLWDETDISIYWLTLGTWPNANTLLINWVSDTEWLVESIASIEFGKNMTDYNEIFIDKEFLSLQVHHTSWKVVEYVDLIALDRLLPWDITLETYLAFEEISVGDWTYGSMLDNNESTLWLITALVWLMEDNLVFLPDLSAAWDDEVLLGNVFEFAVTTPDAFSFNPVTSAALSTLVSSNVITITGINTSVFAAVSEWSEIRANDWEWSIFPIIVEWWDTLQVRTTSASNNATTTETLVEVGWFDTIFSVTTLPRSGGWGWGWWIIPVQTTTQDSDNDESTDHQDDTWDDNEEWDTESNDTQETDEMLVPVLESTDSDALKALLATLQEYENDATFIQTSWFDNETYLAHQFALALAITTIPNIHNADVDGSLIRAHMAKMFVEFATKVLEKEADETKVCLYNDLDDQDEEMSYYIVRACQMWIMGVAWDGITPLESFNPNWTVTRAQTATVLSRILWWNMYDDNDPWYQGHIDALAEQWYITNTDPELQEQRWFFMIMLQRVAQQILATDEDKDEDEIIDSSEQDDETEEGDENTSNDDETQE